MTLWDNPWIQTKGTLPWLHSGLREITNWSMDDLARIRLRAIGLVSSLVIAITLLSWQSVAWPHAFVSRSEPRSGATLGDSPNQVRIWFDGPIESLFADIKVE